MASADRARGKLLSLPRVKNKFIAALDCVAIFGTRSTERPIGWLVHRTSSASDLENASVAKGNGMIALQSSSHDLDAKETNLDLKTLTNEFSGETVSPDNFLQERSFFAVTFHDA